MHTSKSAEPSRRATAAKPHVVLDRDSPLPLYAQVGRRLKAMISSGEHPADRFHSEGELCAMFGVSRATVRQALGTLADEGWLNRRRGRGTSVNREKFDEAFGPQMNFLDQWAHGGRPLAFDLRRFQIGPCPRGTAAWLLVETGTPVLCIERLRLEDGCPVSYDYRYIHPDLAACVNREEASSQSLLVLLGRHVRLARGENKVEAALAGALGARRLGMRPSDPMMIREMVYFDDDEVPAMAGRSLYRADKVRCAFTVDLTPGDGEPASIPYLDTQHWGGMAALPVVRDWPSRPRGAAQPR